MLFECKAFEEERAAFLARLYSVCPLARQLTDEYRDGWSWGTITPGVANLASRFLFRSIYLFIYLCYQI